MNSRLFHLQGVGYKIVNCTQEAKKEKKTGRTNKKIKAKSIDIDRSLCVK